jgi:hypothetical protein
MVSQNPGSQGASTCFVGRCFVPALAFAADTFRETAAGSVIWAGSRGAVIVVDGVGGDGAARSGHAVGGTSEAVTEVEVVTGSGAAVADPEPPSAPR